MLEKMNLRLAKLTLTPIQKLQYFCFFFISQMQTTVANYSQEARNGTEEKQVQCWGLGKTHKKKTI